MPQSNKIDLRGFREKLSFESLFSCESCISPVGFLYVLKMNHIRLFIIEKIGFGMAPKRCGIYSKHQPLLQKTYIFHASETPVAYTRLCLRTHALAFVCRLLPMYIGRKPLWSFITKNRFLCI